MSDWNPYALPGAQVRRMTAAQGREYQLMLAVPRKSPPSNGFPIIYLLDANALFGTMVEALRMSARRSDATGVPDAIVVGIGYPGVDLYDHARRTFDFTFGPPSESAAAGDPALSTGGGAGFLDFLESDVKPRIQDQAPVDAARQTLFGHSLGGLFALSVLARSPRSFSTYVASSPSIWWDLPGLFDGAPRLGGEPGLAARTSAMLCAGEYEQKLAPWQTPDAEGRHIARRRRERAMVDNARELARRLKDAGVRVAFHEFAGEDHASAPLLAINRGLRFALQRPPQESAGE